MQAVILENRGMLRLAGATALPFLQGLVTADLGSLAPDRACYSCLLTPQGKFLFDFHLSIDRSAAGDDGEHAILLETDGERAADLERRLKLYRLRSPIESEPVEPPPSVAMAFGRGVIEACGLAAEAGAMRRDDGPARMVDPRLPELGVRLYGERRMLDAWLMARDIKPAAPEALRAHRIALAVPEAGEDLVVDKTIMLEAGLERLGAVAFDKGCYVGQELTARTHYRGLVKRRLVPVALEGAVVQPGFAVMAGEREAGEIRSTAPGLAMALLRLDRLGEPLEAGGGAVRPLPAPWQDDLAKLLAGPA